MRILVLSWEFPPRIVGGLARHVAELYPEMVKLGHEIHLVTVNLEPQVEKENIEGIWVHRVPVARGSDFLQWVSHMNVSFGDYSGRLLLQAPFDLIHAHDWLVSEAAIALKHHFQLPLVTTIHATEAGRHGGLFNDGQRYIDARERDLIHHSWRVIVCTEYMRREVSQNHHYPSYSIDVVANGIRAEKKALPQDFDVQQFRREYAEEHEKIFYYVGRMTYEKGIYVLFDAAARVLKAMDNQARLVMIGGGNTESFRQRAMDMGLGDRCLFTGFMADDKLNKFQAIADCAVFPSLYEPFGIVALESFAARVPVVVSDAGGLPEVVRNGETGIVTRCNDPESLAAGVLSVLGQQIDIKRIVQRAYAELERQFSWPKLAKQTEQTYRKVLALKSEAS